MCKKTRVRLKLGTQNEMLLLLMNPLLLLLLLLLMNPMLLLLPLWSGSIVALRNVQMDTGQNKRKEVGGTYKKRKEEEEAI